VSKNFLHAARREIFGDVWVGTNKAYDQFPAFAVQEAFQLSPLGRAISSIFSCLLLMIDVTAQHIHLPKITH
jgi:hypothetical protein